MVFTFSVRGSCGAQKPKNQQPAERASPSVDAVSGHLVTCQILTVRRCREVSRSAHLSSGLSSQSSLLTSPARCCELLCNYSDLLRLTGFTLKTVTTHNTFCVKMDTAVAISELNTSRGSHSFFPCFFFSELDIACSGSSCPATFHCYFMTLRRRECGRGQTEHGRNASLFVYTTSTNTWENVMTDDSSRTQRAN